MYIAVGFTEKSHVNDNAQFVKVIKTIPHPDSVSDLLSNDIGLLKVQKLNFTTYVRPACLNTNSTIQVDRAIATGWGKLGFRRNSSDALLKVNLNLFTMEQCRAQMGNINMNVSEGKHICAGSMTEIKDTCSVSTNFICRSIVWYTADSVFFRGIQVDHCKYFMTTVWIKPDACMI